MLLLACQQQIMNSRSQSPTTPRTRSYSARIHPSANISKKITIELVQRPLMDPVTGKITYDETHTARVSSPIAGRVIGAIAALGATLATGDALVELDSPELGQAQSA